MKTVYTLNMNIAIWGMGVSGVSALRYLSTTDHNLFVINQGTVDSWSNLAEITKYVDKARCIEDQHIPDDLQFDQIILAPGIDRKSVLVKRYIDQGIEVICEVELAYRSVDLPIVAVTGTNGKTSTVTMMKLALEKAGKKVFLGGNIGTPFCDLLVSDKNYDVVVLELSSFQLESLKECRAQVAIILNITESHMERYHCFKDYEDAKLNIVMNQAAGDLFICPTRYLGTQTKGKKSPVVSYDQADFTNSKLIGKHHKENLRVVDKTLEFFNVSGRSEIIQEIVNDFGGVKFRLQLERKTEHLTFINDGKSTNLDATLSAVKTFESDKVILILGGKLRSDNVDFLDELKEQNISQILAFGESAQLISKQLSSSIKVNKFKNLDSVFDFIKENITSGIVLFSPAFPSFDLYTNYVQRGEHFKTLVNSLDL